MSSLTARLGLEYSSKTYSEQELLTSIFESFSFPDDLPINSFSRVLSKHNSDINDHIAISKILYFVHIQAAAPLTMTITDANALTSTIVVNRLFTLIGSSINLISLINTDINNTVELKVLYC